jgi:deoxynucleoside triphosphate triphosphohydrolase SAMHD1
MLKFKFKKKKHASIAMLDFLIEDNNLQPVLSRHGIHKPEIHFIKELVLGSEEDAPLGFQWKGQPPEKAFLYDIVANHRNGIDVDKVCVCLCDC